MLDLHNTGCVSFVYMLELARSMIDSGQFETALICNVQTAAGRVFALPDNRVRPPSAIPGDGCGVGLIRRDGRSPVLAMAHRCIAEYATDMRSTRDGGAAWWEPGDGALRIYFDPDTIASIIERGDGLVPDVVREACARAGRSTEELDLLITNQPNPQFLEHWRSALGSPPSSMSTPSRSSRTCSAPRSRSTSIALCEPGESPTAISSVWPASRTRATLPRRPLCSGAPTPPS